ncbi:Uma2 family endonuclease [Cohnella caldifontis]|uniref:Uma2 family endonuclease n=1 Tax=Cohnella caldifontis TaxID=3027471 RepID=UPI0023EA7CEF|nr:Uma2 family endonuclease [Cohnella sp. YIM B05605]
MNHRKKTEDRVRVHPVTYEAYAEMPDDGQRYEIIDGVLEAMSPGPSVSHQSVSREMEFVFMQSCRSDYLIFHAPLDVILSQTDVVQPDILLIHRSRSSIVTERGIEGAPDLVVEIVSPGSRTRDKIKKMKTYAKYGVPEYWIVDSGSRTLERYELRNLGSYELNDLFEESDTVASDKLPCVSFVLAEIFKDIQRL